ncbi:hypothetical protein WKV44_04825 [Spirochaetia bacterium 38H-sp]|uniref:Uncharacterized protein n=1 Tax=Rarispira pelagica TaxID=3141764 RepID=A0ABU9UD38_9SPIR
MVRIARKIDPKRIEHLKKMIDDERYLNQAIDRIAAVITVELIEHRGFINEQEKEIASEVQR